MSETALLAFPNKLKGIEPSHVLQRVSFLPPFAGVKQRRQHFNENERADYRLRCVKRGRPPKASRNAG